MAIVDVPAPMAGTVKELLVAAGEAVTKYQELLIIESMKMEIPLECPEAGTVAEVLIEAPGRIDEGQVLLRIEVG